MRRFALLGLCTLALSGCAFKEWNRIPFIAHADPHAPSGEAENMRRARGDVVAVEPLSPAPGNIWPGPLPPTPSLNDLVKQESQGQLPQLQLLPGQPSGPSLPAPQGSLAPPPPVQPVLPEIPPVPEVARPPGAEPQPAPPAGGVLQTPQGPAVTSGGTSSFKSVTMPNGVTGIVVPNGNGTSTIIMSNGQVQTVPTPK